jgi:hypothetical protein
MIVGRIYSLSALKLLMACFFKASRRVCLIKKGQTSVKNFLIGEGRRWGKGVGG